MALLEHRGKVVNSGHSRVGEASAMLRHAQWVVGSVLFSLLASRDACLVQVQSTVCCSPWGGQHGGCA